MSMVSDAYDNLLARIGSLFPAEGGYHELTNPYDVEDNSNLFLVRGWGMAIGAMVNTNLLTCNTVSSTYEGKILITRELASQESDTTRKHDRVKELLEDQRRVLNDFQRSHTLEDEGFEFELESGNGIQTVRIGNFSYLMIEMNFNVKFFDPN